MHIPFLIFFFFLFSNRFLFSFSSRSFRRVFVRILFTHGAYRIKAPRADNAQCLRNRFLGGDSETLTLSRPVDGCEPRVYFFFSFQRSAVFRCQRRPEAGVCITLLPPRSTIVISHVTVDYLGPPLCHPNTSLCRKRFCVRYH